MNMNEVVEMERAAAARLASGDEAHEEELQDRSACSRLVRLVENTVALMGPGCRWRHPNMTAFGIAVSDDDDCRELARRGGVGSRLAVAAHTGLREHLDVLLAQAGWSEREEVLCGPWKVQWRTEVASGRREDGELRIAGVIAEVHVADWMRATAAMERAGEDWLYEVAAGSATMSRDGSLRMRDPFMWTTEGAGWVQRVLGVTLAGARAVPAYDWHLSSREARRVRERHRAHQHRDRYDVADDLLDIAADLDAAPQEARSELR